MSLHRGSAEQAGLEIPEGEVDGGDRHRADARTAGVADGADHRIPRRLRRQRVEALDDVGELRFDQRRRRGVGVAEAETALPAGERVNDDNRRRVPGEGAVGLRRVGWHGIRANLELVDGDIDPRARLPHRPGRNSWSFCFIDCLTISLEFGSPESKAEVSAFACSIVMWGGSGGTSGSVIAS